MKPLVFD